MFSRVNGGVGRRCALALAGFVFAALLWPVGIRAQAAGNVLVVSNAASEGSVRIAATYARARLVPTDNVLRLAGLAADPPDEIERTEFDRLIQLPIARWLTTHAAQDRILCIVLTKGIPLRISGSSGPQGTVSSVDSELALLYRRMTGAVVPVAGSVPNPYFLENAQPPPFTHERFDIYLVTRLDAFSVDDALALIERARHPSGTGRFVLDEKASWTDKGNDWLRAAAERLAAAGVGDRVVLEKSARVATGERNVLGYYSWGSNDPAIRVRRFGTEFEPGALAAMFVSSDARTFREPSATWQLGSWDNKATWFAGSPQSLAGDLVQEGVTGVAGHVAEPYLRATIRPDILFPAYVSGRTLAESFYAAMPALSWQTVVVGDPLCAPFQAQQGQTQTIPIDPGLDKATELPRWFGTRRLAALSASGRNAKALRLLLRAEARGARGDKAGSRTALEEATTIDGGLLAAHMQLATLYEAAGEYSKAIARYRLVLERKPDDVAALNNLAFALAVRAGAPAEALPFAERAHRLAPSAAAVTDTLGWVYVLLGRAAEAIPLLERATTEQPALAEAHLHLARAYHDAGRSADARRALDEALSRDSALATVPDVKRLQQAIK